MPHLVLVLYGFSVARLLTAPSCRRWRLAVMSWWQKVFSSHGTPQPTTPPALLDVSQNMLFGLCTCRLGASEDAASLTVLCSDKTGTLTKNEMTVKEVFVMPQHNAGWHGINGQVPERSLLHDAVLASKLSNQDPVRIT
jgi:hypothetical protein